MGNALPSHTQNLGNRSTPNNPESLCPRIIRFREELDPQRTPQGKLCASAQTLRFLSM